MECLEKKQLIVTNDTSNNVVVTNGITQIVFSRQNGCITEIRDIKTGKVHCTVMNCMEYARLFRMVVSTPQKFNKGRACDAHVQKNIVWDIDDKGITIRYPDLICDDGLSSGCSAEVRIESSDRDEINLSLRVENMGENTIHEVQFPMLPGWKNIEGEPLIDITGGAKWKWQVGRLPSKAPAYCKWYQQVNVDYPGSSFYLPWLDFSSQREGVSLINYMKKPMNGGVGGINLKGHEKGNLECYWWRYYPLIKKGLKWKSPIIGVSVHEGDWHETADRYYKWFSDTIGFMEQPKSLRTSIGFQNIVLRYFDESRVNDAESLIYHARTGKQYGIKHLSVWDSPTIGNYAIYEADRDLFDYTPQEINDLRSYVLQMQNEGVTTSALINFRHINVLSPLYQHYKTEAVKCHDGSEQRECWNSNTKTSNIRTNHLGLNCMLLSPRSQLAQSRINSLLDKYLNLGYSALFYDQPFMYTLDYNLKNPGDQPDDVSSYLYDLIAKVRSRMQDENPEGYLIGEQFDVFSASKAIDLHMEWNFTNGGIGDLARVLYSCPHALLSYVIDGTSTNESEASHAFASGLLLCITIDGGESNIGKRPELAEHISKLAALREKCASRIAFARFREKQGIELNADPGIIAYGFDSSDGPAVVVAAGKEGGKAHIRIDLSRFHTPIGRECGKLYLMDGDVSEVSKDNKLEYTLAPNEVVVWYC